MNATERAKKNILEFRTIREDIIGDTAIEHYYTSLTTELGISDLPIIVCNTLEKRTSFVETHKNQFFLVFDNYVIELFYTLNKFISDNYTKKDIQTFFYKLISEECYIRLKYKPAMYFAGKYLNDLDVILFRPESTDSLDHIPNDLFVQQAFLVAHELSHFLTRVKFKNQPKYIEAKKKSLYNIYEYAQIHHVEISSILLSAIKSANVFEECLCDSVGLIQAIDIGTKIGNISALRCSIFCVITLMNLCILSMVSINVEEKIFYNKTFDKFNLRILQLKCFASKYLREYFSINEEKEFEDAIEEMTFKWMEKAITPLLELEIKNINIFAENPQDISTEELETIKSILKQIYKT